METISLRSETSPTIGALAAALAKAQGAMKFASKDSTNPHFKSKYADLAAVWEAIREPLSANGLAIFQNPSSDANGIILETILMHASGEFIRSTCWMPVAQKTAQAYGSATTYARRYSLAAVAGVAADDDDGNAASVPASGELRAVMQAARRVEIQDVVAEDRDEKPLTPAPPRKATPWERMQEAGKSKGLKVVDVGRIATRVTNKTKTNAFTEEDVDLVLKEITASVSA